METQLIKDLLQELPRQPMAPPTRETTVSSENAVISNEGSSWRDRFCEVSLTEEEKEQALYEARKKKFASSELKNYWNRVQEPLEYKRNTAAEITVMIKEKIALRSGHQQFNSYPDYEQNIIAISHYLSGELSSLTTGRKPGTLNLELETRKGLLLMGPVGCGKTELMNGIMLNQKQSFCSYTAPDLTRYVMGEGNYNIIDRILANDYMAIADLKYGQKQCGVFIDELGSENEVNVFGNRKNVMAELIIEFYSRCFKQGRLFHATTNLNVKQMKELYGDRVTSRLREMVNVITFPDDAEDFRK
jgi:DNA replication protein DnaC